MNKKVIFRWPIICLCWFRAGVLVVSVWDCGRRSSWMWNRSICFVPQVEHRAFVCVCVCVRACVCVFRRVLILSALKYDLFFAQFISSRSFLVHFIMLSTYCVSVLLFFNKFTRYLILIFMLIRSVVHLRVCCRQWEYGKDKTNTQSLTTLTTAARFPHACFNALCFTAVWSFEGYSGREK